MPFIEVKDNTHTRLMKLKYENKKFKSVNDVIESLLDFNDIVSF